MSWLSFAGIAGVVFFICFLGWFSLHPVSRDRLLTNFGGRYFVVVAGIMVASALVIAMFLPEDLGARGDLDKNPFVAAIQLCVKMREAKDLDINIFGFVFLMLFQIVVFEGLVLAAIVGWTSRRTDQLQNGNVRYKVGHLNGKIVSKWDKVAAAKGFKQKCREFFAKTTPNAYAVVIGANEVAASVIKHLLTKEQEDDLNYCHEKENQYVILQTSSNIEEVRQTLKSHLTETEYERVIIYSSQRDSFDEIRQLELEEASEIYILGENTTWDGQQESYHDAMNMQCLRLVADVLDEYRLKQEQKGNNYRRKVCRVMFEYQTTYSVFQFSDLSKQISENVVFIPFNRYESWAKRVLVDNVAEELMDQEDNSLNILPPIHYTPLDGYEGIGPEDKEHVHMVIVGMSKMGVAMGIQTLLQAHYPNAHINEDGYQPIRSRITFIDTHADKELSFFKGRYQNLFDLVNHRYFDANDPNGAALKTEWIDPMKAENCAWKHLSKGGNNFLDVEIEFVKGELESEGVRSYLREISKDPSSKLTIAICLTQTHQAVAASLYMPIEVYTNPRLQQILVYQREAADIVSNLQKGEQSNKRYEKLRPFGMLFGNYMTDRTYFLKAMLVNALYDMNAKDDETGKEYRLHEINMADDKTYVLINKLWKNLSIAKKWSNKYFVDTIYQKIRSIWCWGNRVEGVQESVTDYLQERAKRIGGYRNAIFDNENFYLELARAIQANESVLEICEHNRWNVQQLLAGFAPCSADEFEKFKQLNAALDDKERKKWRKEVNWANYGPLKQNELKQREDYKLLSYGKYELAKEAAKDGGLHIHPNICDFYQLKLVDKGAAGYDQALNIAIPQILVLVDGHHSAAKTYWAKNKLTEESL